MPWRSRLIASTRSSRSVVSVACWASTSRSSSSARRLTAPSRSRSRRSRSSSVLDRRRRRAAPRPASISASAATASGSTSSISRISWAMSVSRRLAPSKRSSARAASSRAAPIASSAARAARSASASAFSASARRSAAARRAVFGGFDLADQRAALLGKGRRRVFERRRAPAWPRRCAVSSVAIWPTAPSLRSLQSCALGGDRGEAAVGKLGFARERLRFGAHFGEHARACRDLAADVGELALRDRRPAAAPRARSRLRRAGRDASSRLAVSRALGLGQRGKARGVAARLALGGMACASRALSASRCASRRALRAAVSASPAAQARLRAASTRAALVSASLRAVGKFGIDIGEAVALRRAGAPRRSAHSRRRQSRPSARGRLRARPAAGRA